MSLLKAFFFSITCFCFLFLAFPFNSYSFHLCWNYPSDFSFCPPFLLEPLTHWLYLLKKFLSVATYVFYLSFSSLTSWQWVVFSFFFLYFIIFCCGWVLCILCRIIETEINSCNVWKWEQHSFCYPFSIRVYFNQMRRWSGFEVCHCYGYPQWKQGSKFSNDTVFTLRAYMSRRFSQCLLHPQLLFFSLF